MARLHHDADADTDNDRYAERQFVQDEEEHEKEEDEDKDRESRSGFASTPAPLSPIVSSSGADIETGQQGNNNGNSNDNDSEGEVEPVVTPKTWVVAMILSAGYGLSFWPIPAVSAVGELLVAEEFGEDVTAANWFVPAWTIAITVCFMICGSNTDVLGRRWFLVGGNLVCTVGHVIIATARSAHQMTAGLAVEGFGAACCQMAAFALPELLPNKWRHIAVVIADATIYVAVTVAPATARYAYESGAWQWNFGAPAVFQFLSFLGLYFLYFPPALPAGLPLRRALAEIDYPGIALFVLGAVPVLTGIVWAGIYTSSSNAHVVAPLTVGGVFLTHGWALHPLTPPRIFTASRGRDFTAPVLALTVANMFYYSSSILWPTMIAVQLAVPQGLRWQWQLTGAVFVTVLFGALLGLATPRNRGAMLAFVFVSQAGLGWALYLSIMLAQMGVEQRDLGISGGVAGAFRFAGGAVVTSVYRTILNKQLSHWTPRLISTTALSAGLPAAELPLLIQTLSSSLGGAVPAGTPPAVAAAATEALKQA
ncbi:uncharacterized protein K452DRAFT_350960 [Aplosporella prunicola CBS 121167]|uniref:Major facilitator superfamily (MFS) profile domain-containing protein n=1 Tax=Aplosporella prunicola CBS 121167 TaxID=1176127 RepID=A0A6A6BET3_9PEZI|nr:uncharacterized protein K452DRAFT_350960 [Aplosporella prunicola CBS 121167]KAF2142679.1 hypothetical protein K452DRAFT_350960 [Aplosporella prunicola CBS 121167]